MYSEFDREIGEERVEQERQARVDAVRRAMKLEGADECTDCGCTIPIARKRVYPAATRCLECQEMTEKEAYLR